MASQPHALVYRGPAASPGCPEGVARLLTSSPSKFQVTYVGPDEDVQLTADALRTADVYAHPGGGSLGPAWDHMKEYTEIMQDYVSEGGRYLGFCLGAYLAGHDPGFGLLAEGDDTDTENDQPGTQVSNGDDTVINVDWTFSTGAEAGQTQKKRWLYFQDGAVITLASNSTAKVLGRYSSNQDPAATLSRYGKGWVGLIGPHPEANQSWYDEEDISNPEGIRFDIGYDFVEATMQAAQRNNASNSNSTVSPTQSAKPAASTSGTASGVMGVRKLAMWIASGALCYALVAV